MFPWTSFYVFNKQKNSDRFGIYFRGFLFYTSPYKKNYLGSFWLDAFGSLWLDAFGSLCFCRITGDKKGVCCPDSTCIPGWERSHIPPMGQEENLFFPVAWMKGILTSSLEGNSSNDHISFMFDFAVGDGGADFCSSQVQTCMSGSQGSWWTRINLFGEIVSGLDILIGYGDCCWSPELGIRFLTNPCHVVGIVCFPFGEVDG